VAQVRESVTVNLIEVPVTVVDGRGNPVRGLTKANFEVFDQGKKQSVTTFEAIDFAGPRPATAISPLNPVARRSFLLLFDLAFSSPNSIVRGQEAARRFVRESLQPRDLVAVAVIDQDRGCRLLSSFTTDRELIASAIADPAAFRSVDPLGISNQTRAFIPELDAPGMWSGAREPGIGIGGRGALGAANELDMAIGMERMNEGLVRQRVERHVDALGELAQILNAVPGHKQVLLLSDGPPGNILVGRDAHDIQGEREQAERIIRGEWVTSAARAGDADTDRRFGTAATQTLLERMVRAFNQSDVVLHALDLQGARVQNGAYEGAKISTNSGLAALARPTGGDVFQNSNQLADDFARLLHQQEVVYVLGYQTSSPKTGTFHELKVKVSGAGRARVSHRAGYVDGATAAERRLNDAEIIINDIPQSEIRMATLAAPLPPTGDRAAVPLIFDFNGEDLLRDVAVADAEAQLFVYAFDESGMVRDRFFDRLVLHTAAAGDDLRRGGLRYYATLSLPPGKYAIKSLVRVPQTGRKGYARFDVEVPHTGEVAFLPLLPLDSGGAILVRGTSHAANVAYPFHMNGEPFMPAALGVRSGNPKRRFALFAFNVPADDISLDAGTVDAKLVIVSRMQGDNVAKIVFEVAGDDGRDLELVVHSSRLAADRHVRIPLEGR
jgi:VWFA-related protein